MRPLSLVALSFALALQSPSSHSQQRHLMPMGVTGRSLMQGVQLMKRIYVNLTDEQAAALKQRAAETGVLQAEQIRRAITLTLFAEAQQANSSKKATE